MNTNVFTLQVRGSRATKDGRDYVVAPSVMLVTPGVYNGEFVPTEELATFLSAWNDVPVVVRHPRDSFGNPTSAKGLEVQRVGRVYNAQLASGKLKGDLWIDIEAAESVGAGAVVNAIEQGELVEVSTGYFRIFDPTPGVFNEQPYAGISRTLVPDHLALLPDQVGACSVKGGCGVPRVNDNTPTPPLSASSGSRGGFVTITHDGGITFNTLAPDELDLLRRTNAVNRAWWDEERPGWPLFIYDTYVVASDDANIYKVSYDISATDNGYGVTFGESVVVRMSFDPVSPTAPQENIMRESIIQLLSARTGTDATELEARSDVELLDLMLGTVQPAPAILEEQPTPCFELSARIEALGGIEKVVSILEANQQEVVNKRNQLLANAQNATGIPADQLVALDDAALQKLALPRNYIGQAPGVIIDNNAVEYRTI